MRTEAHRKGKVRELISADIASSRPIRGRGEEHRAKIQAVLLDGPSRPGSWYPRER